MARATGLDGPGAVGDAGGSRLNGADPENQEATPAPAVRLPFGAQPILRLRTTRAKTDAGAVHVGGVLHAYPQARFVVPTGFREGAGAVKNVAIPAGVVAPPTVSPSAA